MEKMETPSPVFDEKIELKNQEKFKVESKYIINSNKNNSFNIIIRNLTSYIEINASYKDNIKRDEFKENIL